MNATPQYFVTDPADWSGAAYVTTSKEDAFAAWRVNSAQQVTLVEFDGRSMSGKAFAMNADFEGMLSDERTDARSSSRHVASFARAS